MGNVSIRTNGKDIWRYWGWREKAVNVIVSGDPRPPTTLFTVGRSKKHIISGNNSISWA